MIGFVYADKSSAKTLLKKVKAKKGLVSGTEKKRLPKKSFPLSKANHFPAEKKENNPYQNQQRHDLRSTTRFLQARRAHRVRQRHRVVIRGCRSILGRFI